MAMETAMARRTTKRGGRKVAGSAEERLVGVLLGNLAKHSSKKQDQMLSRASAVIESRKALAKPAKPTRTR